MLEAPTSKDLKIFFTGFLENLLQQDVVAASNLNRFRILESQNVRVAHHFQATQQKIRLDLRSWPAVFG
jgi:hypothetical protein